MSQDKTADLATDLRSLADCDARAGNPLGKCMRRAANEIEHMRMVMQECADAIRDQDEHGALRMLEVCLTGGGRK